MEPLCLLSTGNMEDMSVGPGVTVCHEHACRVQQSLALAKTAGCIMEAGLLLLEKYAYLSSRR